ncbi:MAG: hypothetical protein K2N46_09560 [Lachnospiraceae bacterium]|nr:hypothetical protein [Lachnospiraceae bacterium]
MGLDLYLEARIRDRKTGRILSSVPEDNYVSEDEKGFFEICWWCSSDFYDIRKEMIRISNRHAKTSYTDSDFIIPVPKTALRDIYAYLVTRACLPADEHFNTLPDHMEWQHRNSYEKMNLINAEKLHDLLWMLEQINHEDPIPANPYIEYILHPDDQRFFEKEPQACEWEFRIFNSY